jgi:feruloyl-CoA synthase
MAWLRHWAAVAPDRTFLAEREGDAWRRMTYGQTLARVAALSQRLLRLEPAPDRPLAVLMDNGIAHALLVLAALRIGAPVGVVSPSYAAPGAAPGRLGAALEVLNAAAIFIDRPELYGEALRGVHIGGANIWTLEGVQGAQSLMDLEPLTEAEAARAEADVGPDTVAKLLFTSGSTGTPKAVVNTQRMMVSNMDALAAVWPFLLRRPPRLVDWLPWSHTFGGNCCFNLALRFGGAFHVDGGRPTPQRISETVQNIKSVRPNVYFNVPSGYEALLPFLEHDRELSASLFEDATFLFSAGAALPQTTRDRLEKVAGRLGMKAPPIVSGWGATETAPFATAVYFRTRSASNIGAPIPGVTLKLDAAAGRRELRVKGPNVTPGYWRNIAATEAAFDPEGFYAMGDAGRLEDPAQPARGILYDGRLAENFKLNTGTWVNVGAVRLALIGAADPLVSDVVVCGHDRDELGALIFPRLSACRALIGDAGGPGLSDAEVVSHPGVLDAMASAFRRHNGRQRGSSVRIARFAILVEPPNPALGEVTDKGYLNQRMILDRRAEAVGSLFVAGHLVDSEPARA